MMKQSNIIKACDAERQTTVLQNCGLMDANQEAAKKMVTLEQRILALDTKEKDMERIIKDVLKAYIQLHDVETRKGDRQSRTAVELYGLQREWLASDMEGLDLVRHVYDRTQWLLTQALAKRHHTAHARSQSMQSDDTMRSAELRSLDAEAREAQAQGFFQRMTHNE